MRKTAIDDADHVENPLGVNTVRRPLSEALETDNFGMVYYELEPGDAFSAGPHRHNDQEEVFCILSGTVDFEIGARGLVCRPSGIEASSGRGAGGSAFDLHFVEGELALFASSDGPRPVCSLLSSA